MKFFGETRKLLENKFRGSDTRRKWSEDDQFLYARLWDGEKGRHQWYSYDTVSGERRVISGQPKGKPFKKLVRQPAFENRPYNPSSPNGKWTADVDGNVVTLTETGGKPVLQAHNLTGTSKWQNRFDWAPDSSAFVAWHVTDHPVRTVHYVRSSPEGTIQPEYFTRAYEKPGDKLNIPRPVVFFTDGSAPLPLAPSLSKDPFEIRNLLWHTDSKSLTVEFIERGYGEFKLIELDMEARTQRALVSEKSDKFVFVYGNTYCRHLGNGEEILWLSQRTGYNHLYLVNRRTGEATRALTRGDYVVREIVSVDEKQRTVLVAVSGIDPRQDPYYIHYLKISLDTGKSTRLTASDGTHEIFHTPGAPTYVARWSRVDHPPVDELRSWADGKVVATLPIPSVTGLEDAGWQAPERFVCKDRNGQFDIHGVIFRPLNFDPAKKYPVIEYIYAGPHGSFVPKEWSLWYGELSEMAESGFIVVQIDGLGTNHRGKEFHEYAYKNLMDSGFPDRILWIKAAAEKYPQMDLGRIGIFGGSAGGQSALAALLSYPEFYKAAAADCGCHDNRMDKIWWNEQWMDWPVDESYAENSNLTHISKLEGALLLTVGEVDTNVDPSSTYQVVNALIEADKDFEFYMVPNGKHGAGESPYLRRKRIEFFRDHLLIQNPAK